MGSNSPHHIHDLLRGRYLLRHGQSLHELLWVPGISTASQPTDPSAPTTNAQNASAAARAAEAWSSLLKPST